MSSLIIIIINCQGLGPLSPVSLDPDDAPRLSISVSVSPNHCGRTGTTGNTIFSLPCRKLFFYIFLSSIGRCLLLCLLLVILHWCLCLFDWLTWLSLKDMLRSHLCRFYLPWILFIYIVYSRIRDPLEVTLLLAQTQNVYCTPVSKVTLQSTGLLEFSNIRLNDHFKFSFEINPRELNRTRSDYRDVNATSFYLFIFFFPLFLCE
jgi:hypothetical protein